VIYTFLSVLPAYQNRGIDVHLFNSTQERFKEFGIDFSLLFLEPKYSGLRIYQSSSKLKLSRLYSGHFLLKIIEPWEFSMNIDMNIMLQAYFGDNMKIHFYHDKRRCLGAKTFRFLVGTSNSVFQPSKVMLRINERIHKYKTSTSENKKNLLNSILTLSSNYTKSNGLARIWTEPELSWHLNGLGSKTLLINDKNDNLRGFVNYIIVQMWFKKPLNFAWLDNCYLKDLTKPEQQAILFAVTMDALKNRCVAIIVPNLKYFKYLPFIKNGFIPFTRRFEIWRSSIEPLRQEGLIKNCYIDVR
jgi:hypothetical protein